MGRRKIHKLLRKSQKSTNYYNFQHEFFDDWEDFQPDKYARLAINKQMKILDEDRYFKIAEKLLKEVDDKMEVFSVFGIDIEKELEEYNEKKTK